MWHIIPLNMLQGGITLQSNVMPPRNIPLNVYMRIYSRTSINPFQRIKPLLELHLEFVWQYKQVVILMLINCLYHVDKTNP